MSRRWRTEDGEDDGGPYGPESAPPPDLASGSAGMSSANAVAVVLWIGATIYAVFAGADFGAGLWSLLAGSGDRGRRPRELIDWAIGPVWEANHVWLIFVLVVLWTGFSSAFEAIFSTLFIPLSLAALGIVLRGSGFAFQHTARGAARPGGGRVTLFGLASVLTPFFMGTVVGAIAGGRVPVGNAAGERRLELAQSALARDRRALRRDERLPRGGVPRQRRAARGRARPRALLRQPRARRGARRRRARGRRPRRRCTATRTTSSTA